jgi:putative DNA methylase
VTAHRKKLIEVALPLEAINKAAARAVIFAQMVDDPSSWPDLFPTEKAQEKERQRLFRIIEDLVQWENTRTSRAGTLAPASSASWRSRAGSPAPRPSP